MDKKRGFWALNADDLIELDKMGIFRKLWKYGLKNGKMGVSTITERDEKKRVKIT